MSLDIPERQILLYFEWDRLQWHHRLLLAPLGGGKWCACTPDYEVETIDMTNEIFRPVARAASFPDACRPRYVFDLPLDTGKLNAIRGEAARIVDIITGTAPQGKPPTVQGDAKWYFADPAHMEFGKEVPTDVYGSADNYVIKEGSGLVKFEEEWCFAQLVEEADRADWVDEKRTGSGRDKRLAATPTAHSDGSRSTTLKESIRSWKVERAADFPMPGPCACMELLKGIAATGNELSSFAVVWEKASGISPRSAVANEHRNLISMLHLLVTYDLVVPCNLASAELMARRVLMIQRATRRNSKAPDFHGLEVYISHAMDPSGGIITLEFEKHIAEVQKGEAMVLKQSRMLREEVGQDPRHPFLEEELAQEEEGPGGGRGRGRGRGRGK